MTFRSILADYVLGGNLNNNYALSGAITVGTAGGMRLVLDGQHNALLFYDSSNHLVMSLAAGAGTDGFGHTFPEGLAVSPDLDPSLQLGLLGGTALMFFPSGVTGDLNSGGLQMLAEGGAGNTGWSLLAGVSTKMTSVADFVGWGLESNSDDGVTKTCICKLNYIDTGQGVHSFVTVDATGAKVTAGTVTGVKPGTGTGRGSVAQAATWQSASTLLSALWTTTGVNNPLRYRVEGIGTGQQLRFDGLIQTTGAGPWPAFGNIFTLPGGAAPAGYVPAQNHHFVGRSDIAVAAGQDTVIVTNTGGVQNGQTFTAANQKLYFDGFTFPLD